MTDQVRWDTSGSLHPGRTYSAVQEGMQKYTESMDLELNPIWLEGAWVPSQTTEHESITFVRGVWQNDRQRCIDWAMDFDWVTRKPNTGPVRYISLVDRTCNVFWDTILARSATEPGHTLEIPLSLIHI